MTVRVWDDTNANGIQDDKEGGVEGVQLRLVLDGGLEHVSELMTDGTAQSLLSTNADGYVVFTEVPRGVFLRVQIVNQPKEGVLRTLHNAGSDSEKDSDLGHDGLSDRFFLTKDSMTEIDLGVLMPHDVRVRVWDDHNRNGIQDEEEVGLSGVKVRIIKAQDSSFYEGQCEGDDVTPEISSVGLCNEELTSGEDGLVTFKNVPKGKFHVKVLNKPKGLTCTLQSKGSIEQKDSDLGSNGISDVFDLSTFTEATFDEIGMGFILPRDVEVKVWDDAYEPGVEGASLRLVRAEDGTSVDDQ